MNWFRKCPVCAKRLDPVTHGAVEVDRCPQCQGLWLDNGEFKALLNTRKDLIELIPPHQRANLSHTAHACPSCGDTMQAVPPNNVLPFPTELCLREGGYWIDGSEWPHVVEAAEKKTLRLKQLDSSLESAADEVRLAGVERAEARHAARKKVRDSLERRAFDEGEEIETLGDLDVPRRLVAFLGLPAESGRIYSWPSFVNLAFIALNIAVFVFMISGDWLFGLLGKIPEGWLGSYGFTPVEFSANPGAHWQTLFTSMFMHAGIAHIFGNLFFLFTTGDDVEARFGHIGYFFFYLLAGIAADLASLWYGRGADIPHVGASGAIAGVMGAYVILFPNKRFFFNLRYSWHLVGINAWMYLGFWMATQVVAMRIANSNVDYAAHIGGFIFGAVIAIIIRTMQHYDADEGRWKWGRA